MLIIAAKPPNSSIARPVRLRSGQAQRAIHLALRFFDELAAGFDPVVVGIAGERKPVAAFGKEVGAEANFVVGWFDWARRGRLRVSGCRLFR
jgi:hypothetical protein